MSYDDDQYDDPDQEVTDQADINREDQDTGSSFGTDSAPGISQEDTTVGFDQPGSFSEPETPDEVESSSFAAEQEDSYADDETSEKKVIDGFDEANSTIQNEIREVNQKSSPERPWIKKAVAALVVVLLIFGLVKMCDRGPVGEYDDSMILVMNQTQVTPEKIAVYIKTVFGVDAPVIRIPGLLKEEFSATNVDEEKNMVTWFWTVEGKRAQKAFNKQAELMINKGKEKHYIEEFTLDKEIRIDYQK